MTKKSASVEGEEVNPLAAVPLGQGHYRVTIVEEDLEISPVLANTYAVGQTAVADRANDGDYFVGGHPIKGRNG